MNKNYVLIFLKNIGATIEWVALTPPPTKRVALTLPPFNFGILLYFNLI